VRREETRQIQMREEMRKGEMRRKWVREIGKTREERREKEMKEM